MKRVLNKKGYFIAGLLLLSCLIALKWYLVSEEQIQNDVLKLYPQESNIPKAINLYNIPANFVVRKVFYKNQDIYQIIFIKKRKKIAQQIYLRNKLMKQQGNIPNGLVREYDAKGILKAQFHYKSGKKEGKAIQFEDQTYSVAFYHQDKLNGSFKVYNGRGFLLVEKEYKDGVLQNPIKFYDTKNKYFSEISYDKGEINSKIRYYSDRKNLIQETNLKNTKLDGSVIMYDTSGVLRRYITYKADQLQGLMKEFAPDQSLLSQDFCQNNQLNGLATRYDKGDLIAEEYYKNGVLDGVCKYYRNDRTLKEEVAFVNGIRHGITKIYDEHGNIAKEYTFTEGVLNEK